MLSPRFDRVVPFTVELRMRDTEMFEVIVADLYPCFVFTRVQRGPNNETGPRGGARDEIHDDLVGRKRSASPVLSYETEQTMLNLVPLAGSRWKVTDLQLHSQFVRQSLQRFLPQSIATTVTASAIRGNHQFGRTWKPRGAHFVPPP